MNIKKISFLITYSLYATSSLPMDPGYGGLIFCMKQYITTNTHWHAGDLFEHSVWVVNCMEQWFNEHIFWVEELTETDKKIAVFAGFLHDIGKAGDLVFVYHAKKNHPRDGFEYLLNKKPFYINKNKERFNFDDWFNQFSITSDERALIAILVGIHWEFGKVLRDIQRGSQPYKVFDSFLIKLKKLTQEAHYNNNKVDNRLLRLAILINAADLKGTSPVHYCCSSLLLPTCAPKHSGNNVYDHFNVETKGKEIREQLLYYFEKQSI